MPESLISSNSAETGSRTPRFSRLIEIWLAIAISAALVLPCVWQEHIQAGDLSSHVYNAWLVQQIKREAVPGLALIPVWTNVLTDWALERLMGVAGEPVAERVVAGSAALIFFWGAFFAINAASNRRPWLLCPVLGMVSYGLVFHFGFLNFYLSTGLCLWILGLLWRPTWRRALIAIPLTALAFLAHGLPVVWVFAVLAYLHLAWRVPQVWRILVPVGGVAGLAIVSTVIMSRFPYRWSFSQLASLDGYSGITGVDQVWLFDSKYLIVTAALLIIFVKLFLERFDRGNFLRDPLAQVWILHMVAFMLMPSAIQLPQYQHVLAYIPQRISLFIAVSFGLMVGKAAYGRGITRLSGLAAATFFMFLYVDYGAFNKAEDEVTALVSELPPGQRVVAAITDSDARLNALIHVVDRACIGRCFSYADYEPATGQFRVRIVGPNRVIAPNMTVVQEIEYGHHTVTAREAPLYSVCPCQKEGNRFCLRVLSAGEKTCAFSSPVSLRLWARILPRLPRARELARQSQGQVPDHESGVPIVNKVDKMTPAAPHTEAAQ